MVTWYDRETEIPKTVYNVPVSDLGFMEGEEGKEEVVEDIPVCDLTNDEYVLCQQDPFLEKYPGSLGDKVSPKNQAYTILVTHRRVEKAHMKLKKHFGLTPAVMMKWSITRSGDLAIKIKEHLESVSKKLPSSQLQTKDKSSEMPANIKT